MLDNATNQWQEAKTPREVSTAALKVIHHTLGAPHLKYNRYLTYSYRRADPYKLQT